MGLTDYLVKELGDSKSVRALYAIRENDLLVSK